MLSMPIYWIEQSLEELLRLSVIHFTNASEIFVSSKISLRKLIFVWLVCANQSSFAIKGITRNYILLEKTNFVSPKALHITDFIL